MMLWLILPVLFMIWKYFWFPKHLMMMLLTLEVFMLLNMVMLMYLMMSGYFGMGFYLSYFVVSVGEACVGLSILVYMSRVSGESCKRMF